MSLRYYLLWICSIYIHSYPFSEEGQTRWLNRQCKSQNYSQKTYLHYKKFIEAPINLYRLMVSNFWCSLLKICHLKIWVRLYFPADHLISHINRKEMSGWTRTESHSCISSLQGRRDYQCKLLLWWTFTEPLVELVSIVFLSLK